MKRIKVILLIAGLVFMHACMVSSIHPFFKKEDKTYTTLMEGSWIDPDSCLWTIEPNIYNTGFMSNQSKEVHDSSYILKYYEDSTHVCELHGTLFQLDGIDYMDFTPYDEEDHFRAEFSVYHHVPVHTLARVHYSKDGILFYWYGEEWIKELFEQNRIRIKHERINDEFERHVLTADTDELQKFLKKYGNSPPIAEDFAKALADEDGDDDAGEYGIYLKLKPV